MARRARRGRRWRVGAVAGLLVVAGCSTGFNHPDPAGPRYARPAPLPPEAGSDTVRVASFNIQHAQRVDRALRVLTGTPELREADVLLLQEMDEAGTRRVAASLGMGYVYFPATWRSGTGRDFGNAVLSRWPVVGDAKVVLPHASVFSGSRRTATAATLQIRGRRVRVYSVHLDTPVNQWPWHRRDQLQAVLDDAEAHPLVIVGGDLNGSGIAEMAVDRGFGWPTREGPPTVRWFRWDHLLVRGLEVPHDRGVGTVLDAAGSSDHRPVWVRVVLPTDGSGR